MRIINWFWPLTIVISSVSVVLLDVFNVDSPIRVAIAIWFMGICPGMAFIGLLKLKGILVNITFAIALSLALDMLVSEAIVYFKMWSPETGIISLAILSFAGIVMQILVSFIHKAPSNEYLSDDIHR